MAEQRASPEELGDILDKAEVQGGPGERRRERHPFFSRKLNIVGVLTLVSGILIGLGIPVWQDLWVQAPHLNVNVLLIERRIGDDVVIDIDRFPELSVLRATAIAGGKAGEVPDTSMNPEQLARLMVATKREMAELPQVIRTYKDGHRHVRHLTPETLTLSEIATLNRPLPEGVVVDPDLFRKMHENIEENTGYFEKIIETYRSRYRSLVLNTEFRFMELMASFPEAESRVHNLNAEMTNRSSYFLVTVALDNLGKEGVSINRHALLRVYISSRNYVDLHLELEDFQHNAQIPALQANIVTFRSPEMQELTENARNLLNIYWGQSVHAVLFIEDVLKKVYASEPTDFSRGFDAKLTYGRLEQEASRRVYFLEH